MIDRLPSGLIVNADDLGIHPEINAGILSAYRRGILTSSTMLMTTAYLEQTVSEFVRTAALPVGIHLSLTLGRAAAKPSEVPDLIDADGNLRLSAGRLLLASFTGSAGQRLLAQINREFAAQLGRALDCGLRPTHADTHQHVHMNPPIFAIIEELLPRFGINRLRFCREPFWPFVFGADLPSICRRLNPLKWALIRWRCKHIKPDLVTNDELFGILYSGTVSKSALLGVLGAIGPDRSVEVCIHPGFPAPLGTQSYDRSAYNAFISSVSRKNEHDILVDAEVQDAVRQRGLQLRSYDGKSKL